MRALWLAMVLTACGPSQGAADPSASPSDAPPSAAAEIGAIQKMLDAWHAAAARADEQAYFSFFSAEGVFLGTDATERWGVEAFRKYAHPHFAKGKAWSFRAVRREVMLSRDGQIAWFDEDLATPNLGPARGSGVVLREGGHWRIAHYNLTITVPNERFDEIKKLLETKPETKPESQPEPKPTESKPSKGDPTGDRQ
jgi:hypothetical protein